MSPPPKSPVLYVVDELSGCWIWQRARNNHGYGVVRVNGRLTLAHRDFYEAARGPVPPGLELDHEECDNPACVNPFHVEPVPHVANCRRGRSTRLNSTVVAEIRERVAGGETNIAVAARFGVSDAQVSRIAHGKRWAA